MYQFNVQQSINIPNLLGELSEFLAEHVAELVPFFVGLFNL